jgi:hypothetical protein
MCPPLIWGDLRLWFGSWLNRQPLGDPDHLQARLQEIQHMGMLILENGVQLRITQDTPICLKPFTVEGAQNLGSVLGSKILLILRFQEVRFQVRERGPFKR